jgi:hypothetical protein
MRGTVKKVGVALGAVGAAAAAGLAKATVAAVNYGDAIDKASKRTGISAENLQRLNLAAELSGTNIEGVEKGIKRMSSVVFDAQNGLMESVRAFDALGLSADEMAKKTPDEQLDAFLVALAGVENHSRRAALAQDIFGRAGTQLLPVIDGGVASYRTLIGEADKLNAVLSQDQVTAAANAKDAVTRLQSSLKALGFGAILLEGNKLADVMNTMAERVAAFSESGGLRDLADTLQSIADIMSFIVRAAKAIFDVGATVTKGAENLISRSGLTQTGFLTGQLSKGEGKFGAATASEEMLFRLKMIQENTFPIKATTEGT